MSYVKRMHEVCHTYEQGITHICIRPLTHINKACHANKWDMTHIRTSHVTHMDESWHSHDKFASRLYIYFTRVHATQTSEWESVWARKRISAWEQTIERERQQERERSRKWVRARGSKGKWERARMNETEWEGERERERERESGLFHTCEWIMPHVWMS